MNTEQDTVDSEWAIVELLGHVRVAGRISEVERYGGKMMRLDIPGEGDGFAGTQLIGHSSLYRVTLTTEDVARRVAELARPMPVHRWELPELEPVQPVVNEDDCLEVSSAAPF